MLSALIGLACALAIGLSGWVILRNRLARYDLAAQVGMGGLLGLGTAGWICLPIGLIPGGTHALKFLPLVFIALALITLRKGSAKLVSPVGQIRPIGPILLLVPVLLALVGAAAPSDSIEWDSLAYHLAVPKIWLEAGQIVNVPFIHHSNFPFVVDNLFMIGLPFGESAAKAFNVAFLVFGCATILGLTRQRYGAQAGWVAALAFATVPTVLWESGTAYIDMAHALFAGLGAYLLLVEEDHWVGALLMGFAIGSKYTGMQPAFVAFAILLVIRLFSRAPVKGVVLAGLLTVAVGSPWYVKNAAWTGNPVYPFFHSLFPSKNWSEFNAKIYAEEQATFGVPGRSPDAVAHALLGLSYQPGRYTNPSPKLEGTSGAAGFPFVAFGSVVLTMPILWAIFGRRGVERRLLVFLVISFGLWALLSQQSRYAVTYAPIGAIFAGAAFASLSWRPVIGLLVALQALYSVWLIGANRTTSQLRVVFGQVSREDYRAALVPFAEPAKAISEMDSVKKVALYDEVFGFLLDKPYTWANPGHSMELDYETMNSGDDLIVALQRLGVSHVYLNLSMMERPTAARLAKAAGLDVEAPEFTDEDRAASMKDPRPKWRTLVGDSIESGRLRTVQVFRNAILLEVAR
ncbi:MAG TPA: hypothetical protein PKA27_12985 [Fimbriimonadaceae bacterium]|nr:hypothetical protein [Fimbriimonadaceae bacterium]